MRGKLRRALASASVYVAISAFAPTAAFAQFHDVVMASPPRPVTKKYGPHITQRFDFVGARGVRSAPLIVMVTWSDQPRKADPVFVGTLSDAGFAVAHFHFKSEQKRGARAIAVELAKAIAFLVAHAGDIRVDPRHILLMGKGDGASTAALLACDPSFFGEAGVAFADIKAAVLIDGFNMDAASEIAAETGNRRKHDIAVFGATPAEQRGNTAIGHLDPPNIGSFYITASGGSRTRQHFSRDFADALEAQGVNVELRGMPQSDASQVQTHFGESVNKPTRKLIDYIRDVFTDTAENTVTPP